MKLVVTATEPFAVPPAVHKGPSFPTLSLKLAICRFIIF